ncbi:MAG: ATP-dependent DNA helicase [Candidatus ainarchaeum sp.]|nr:ATP-dependent DNA helicase [Candidatus ainarchaeum sp.]
MEIYFRHPSIRKHQDALIHDANEAIENRKLLLADAPVGLGKTDAVLAPAITYALKHGKTVFFLTPKISQHRIALSVVRGMREKYGLDLRAVDLIGRRYACVDPVLSDLDHESFYQSCERKRRKEECLFYGNSKGHGKVGEAKADYLFKKISEKAGPCPSHEDLLALGRECEACPYEWLIRLASDADVIIADYFHLMHPQIRDLLLMKIRKKFEDSIVIIDEAHNLAKRIRDQLSSSTNNFYLGKLDKETRALGFRTDLEGAFSKWARAELGDAREKLVSQDGFYSILEKLEGKPEELVDMFAELGFQFVERTGRKSHALRFAKFLERWNEKDRRETVRILRKTMRGYVLSKKFLDPSVSTSKLNETHASILMSGTLLPLEMHRDVLGLDPARCALKSYPSPFPEKNRMNILLEGFTTRYSKRSTDEYLRMARMIDRIAAETPGGAAVFFPSYNVLQGVVPLMGSGRMLVQKEKMKPSEVGAMLRDFGRGGVLCGVQGGSLAEGIDYANGEIKCAVVVGVALEEMSMEVEALIEYYDEKFGRGWDYGYLYPGVIRAVQAAGRAIRKDEDRAVVVYMDERFRWKNYRTLLPNERYAVAEDPVPYMKKFWEE